MAIRNDILILSPKGAQLPEGEEQRLERLTVSGGDRYSILFDNTESQEAIWTIPEFPASYQGQTLKMELLCISEATSGNVTLNAAVESITAGDALDLDSAVSFDSANSGTAAVAATAGYAFAVTITLTNKDSLAVGDHCRIKITRDTSDTATGTLRVLAVKLYEDVDTVDLTGATNVTVNALNSITATEIGYLDGIESNIQDQLDAKLESGDLPAPISNYVRLDPSSSSQNVIQPSSASVVPLVVKGASSQTAALQDWQNSSGTVIAYIEANGNLSIKYLSIDQYVNVFNGAVNVGYGASGLSPTGQINGRFLTLVGATANQVVQSIKGASAQSANLTEWQNNSSTVLAYVTPTGNFVDSSGLANRERNHYGTVTDGTITFNCAARRFQSVVISGNCTLSVTNPVDGPACSLRITHGGDNATMAWPNNFFWPDGAEPSLSNTTGKVDSITFQYDATLGGYLAQAATNFAAP